MKPLLLMLITLVVCVSCSVQTIDPIVLEPTLADLEPAVIPSREEALPVLTLSEVSALYLDVLKVNQDPATERLIKERLAALDMMHSEQQLAEGVASPTLFASTISAYQTLLLKQPDSPLNDRLKYQLSKAYALNGEPEKSLAMMADISEQHPYSDHVAEAEFRKAEHAFTQAQYRQAADSYRRVYRQTFPGERYHDKAIYMYGWSMFKMGRYQRARDAFVRVLDLTLPADGQVTNLPRAEKELVGDCFRVLAVSFSYLDGVESIESIDGGMEQHRYFAELYQGLADLYLSQERYQDSADVYRAYIERYPQTDRSHDFFVSAINMYDKAGFSDDVRREKKRYVALFATQGEYWLTRTENMQATIEPQLKAYLIELARYHHGVAQQQKTSKDAQIKQAIIHEHYDQAGDYYLQYLKSFPLDPQAAQLTFLLAESRFESERYLSAIQYYEYVAYHYLDDKQAPEAGYAALVSYDQLLMQTPAEQKKTVKRNKIDSALRFSKQFPNDDRAVPVLAQAANDLLALGDYPRAIKAAEQLTLWPSPVAAAIALDAWIVIAKSSYDSGDFLYAESAYQQALERLPEGDSRHHAMSERIAGSIYKQGELALAAGDRQKASEQFLRVVEQSPQSSVRVAAQYDAATQLLILEQWPEAIALLTDFRQRFPRHELNKGVNEKLLLAYEKEQQWGLAADEVMTLFAEKTVPEKQAELLFYAAELYQRDGNAEQAIVHYRRYAHNYPAPVASNMEAMYQLSEMYLDAGESSKRRFWLKKMIAADNKSGATRTPRSRYLGAFSSAVLADDAYQQFSSISLSLPLKRSMKKKKSAMKTAVSRYEKLNAYELEAFSTLAAYRLGEIYTQLSKDLINSERPAKLDELALEQYEVLLEEQAYPFEEKAIDIHELNAQRSWQGVYTDSVKQSFGALEKLLPARYRKPEKTMIIQEVIY